MSKEYQERTKQVISLEGMEFHAPHGFYEQERKVKNYFVVDVYISMPTYGLDTDQLENTINYEQLHALVAQIMEEPVKLMETICHKIIRRLSSTLVETPASIRVKICKKQPPLPGKVNQACVQMDYFPKQSDPYKTN